MHRLHQKRIEGNGLSTREGSPTSAAGMSFTLGTLDNYTPNIILIPLLRAIQHFAYVQIILFTTRDLVAYFCGIAWLTLLVDGHSQILLLLDLVFPQVTESVWCGNGQARSS